MGCLENIWQGSQVFEEPVCFSSDGNGMPIGGTLLYAPVRILRVTSWDRETVYEEGRDYLLEGRHIRRTADSRIPYLPREVYCKAYAGVRETDWVRLPGGREYMEVVDTVYRYQVLVSYVHSGSWQGEVPAGDPGKLSGFYGKLAHSPQVRLVFYGDSITAGWEASGANEDAIDMVTLEPYPVTIHHPPFLPAWAELVTDALRKKYPHTQIQKYNRAAGGSTTQWGVLHAGELVNPCKPDLVILGFGMNSMQESAQAYQEKITSILTTIRRENPECAFLLVSPMIPNPEIAGFQNNQLSSQEQALREICRNDPNVAIAPVHSVFCQLQRMGKHYLELTGNCINHPNDFSVRIYAQTVLSALTPREETV